MLRMHLAQALDPVIFARAGLGFEPDPVQTKILRSESKRVVLNCHRQFGKSSISAIKALHTALFTPGSLTLLLSPSLRQSGELFRKVTDLSYRVKDMPRKVEDQKQFATLENGSRIVSLPGKEGTVRGYSRVDLLIVDEASRVDDELYLSIRPMLSVSDGSLYLLSTPRGKRGFFHKVWTEGPSWEKYQSKVYESGRISPEFIEEERTSMPDLFFKQEYECAFVEAEGSLFTFDDIRSAFSQEVRPFFGSTISKEITPFFRR